VNAKLFLIHQYLWLLFDKQHVSSGFNKCNLDMLKNKTKWQVMECK